VAPASADAAYTEQAKGDAVGEIQFSGKRKKKVTVAASDE